MTTRLSATARLTARMARNQELYDTAAQLEAIAKEDELRTKEIPYGLGAGLLVGTLAGASIALLAGLVELVGWKTVVLAYAGAGMAWGGYSAWASGRK